MALRLARVEDRQKWHETRHDEFMRKTTEQLAELLERSEKTTRQLDDWKVIRRTLAAVGSLLLTLGAIAGYWIHYFWPIKGG